MALVKSGPASTWAPTTTLKPIRPSDSSSTRTVSPTRSWSLQEDSLRRSAGGIHDVSAPPSGSRWCGRPRPPACCPSVMSVPGPRLPSPPRPGRTARHVRADQSASRHVRADHWRSGPGAVAPGARAPLALPPGAGRPGAGGPGGTPPGATVPAVAAPGRATPAATGPCSPRRGGPRPRGGVPGTAEDVDLPAELAHAVVDVRLAASRLQRPEAGAPERAGSGPRWRPSACGRRRA